MTDQQTILLVDDSENDLVLMKMAFSKADFPTPLQIVYNGEQAIAYLSGEGQYSNRAQFPVPTVILLDLNMPMKDGFAVLEWLRSQPLLPKRISTIVLTASLRLEDVERAFDLGASSYLVKPSTLQDLVAMIRCLRDWLRINHFPPLNEHVRKCAA
jgi:CheY-like chemotaxis protein